MTKLSDNPPVVRPFRIVSGAVSVAVIIAVAEVLTRCFLGHGPFDAGQLALATAANVAVLGTAALLAVLVGAIIGAVVTLPVRALRRHVQAVLVAGLCGGLAGLLAYRTRVFGQEVWLDLPWSNPALAAAVALGAGLSVWRMGLSSRPSLMNLTRGCVLVAWASCVFATAASLHRSYPLVTLATPEEVDTVPSDDAAAGRPNLLLVVLDTLRADHVGTYGNSKLTPNLDTFAQSSITYERAISTAPWTLPSHASMLTGLYPEEHRVSWGNYRLDDEAAVLPELLKTKGYQSFAISNNRLLNEDNGFSRGFDSFTDTTREPRIHRWQLALRCGAPQWLAPRFGLSADAGWDQGAGWTNWLLAHRFRQLGGRPFFGMINYFEPHDPYRPPQRFVDRLLTRQERAAYLRLRQGEEELAAHACGNDEVYTNEQIELLEKAYAADVAYQDEVFGGLIDLLDRTGLLQSTWVVVTSDHGELFGEWDMVYHTAGAHYQLLHVPLLVRPPGGVEARRVAAPVQPVDIFMTFLAQAGLPAPSAVTRAYPLPLDPNAPGARKVCVSQTYGASIAGLSITQRKNMQADLSQWLTWINSVYADGMLLQLDSRGGRSLYDVSRDPLMQTDLADSRGEALAAMLAGFEVWSGAKAAGEAVTRKENKHAALFDN